MLTRRQLMFASVAGVVLGCDRRTSGSGPVAGADSGEGDSGGATDDTGEEDSGLPEQASFDELLDFLHATAVDFGGGLSNHGPMGLEALVTLDREDRLVDWLDDYVGSLHEDQDLDLLTQVEVLLSDMESDGPEAVLAREVAALADGWLAAGWHGPLRAAHAVRSLLRADTPSRRRELAFGLAYWARDHRTLPGVPGSDAVAGCTADDVLAMVPLVAEEDRTGGLITESLAPVDELEGFGEAVACLDLDAEPVADAIHRLCVAAASALLTKGEGDIILLHVLTGSSALRLMLPWLPDETAREALGYAVQVAAAAISAVGVRPELTEADGPSAEELLATAGAAEDVHAIKLGEAILRELDHADSDLLRGASTVW